MDSSFKKNTSFKPLNEQSLFSMNKLVGFPDVEDNFLMVFSTFFLNLIYFGKRVRRTLVAKIGPPLPQNETLSK